MKLGRRLQFLLTIFLLLSVLLGASCINNNPPSRPASVPVPTPEPAPGLAPAPLPSQAPPQTTPATQYFELPKFNYIGITPPPGKPHDLYNLLVEMRHRSNWSSLYTKHEFDCSEMSGFWEFYLESYGFDTYILCAELTGRDWANALGMELERLVGLSADGKLYHAWIAVKIDNEYLAVESTLPGIDTYYGAYKYQWIYRSVEEAEKAWPGEFDWENSSQFQSLQYR